MSKVWLITGSSRGLGLALARRVLESGDRLLATARHLEPLRDLVARYGDQIHTFALDVTDEQAARASVAAATSAFGRLDVVVNNAGYGNVSSTEHMTSANFRAQIEANFFGVVHVTRAALPVLREQRSGHVIQISSIGGRGGSPGLSAYQAAKWGVEGFSEALAREVGPLGVHVTIVEPGGIRTDFAGSSMQIDEIHDDYRETVGALAHQLRRNDDVARGDPAKMARVIVELASLPKPPLRILLGSDAVYLAELTAKQRVDEDAKWRSVSLSTDFDGVEDFRQTPLGKIAMQLLLEG